MHYNTTHETGQQLALYESRTLSQSKRILQYMRQRPGQGFTPEQIKRIVFREQIAPITSVRRALTDLTSQGFLIKTDQKMMGGWGRPQYKWTIAEDYATNPATDTTI